MRILVCGGRNYDPLKVEDYLNEYFKYRPRPDGVIEGGATGADTGARRWGRNNQIPVQTFPADWDGYGKSAGYIRNKQMLDEGQPDLVMAFPGGKGTSNMIEQAKKAGVEVVEVS